ncbi:flagellar hook-basal body protein [Evansella sp. AB-rgal1]|uniref:flagellar hook-basal body protein n=1 Tax=Evansella sp. AB-rgal1 TaxID=3242696 RepID=UPI00359DF681
MIQSMINSSVTMGQLQRKLDTIGHNLSNSNTTGFKRRDVTFSDLLSQQVNNQNVVHHEIGRQTPNGLRVGTGAAVAQTALRLQQGSIQTTERPLDLAITENSYFFELEEADGNRRFTRDGAFYLSPNPNNPEENLLVNQNGEFVLSAEGNRITFPSQYEDILISNNGMIEVRTTNEGNVVVGQLQLVQITKPQLITMLGNNTFVFQNLEQQQLNYGDVLNEAAGTDVIMQRALEHSNVDMGKEMTELMLTQRNYEFNARAISITDQMMGLVNTIR